MMKAVKIIVAAAFITAAAGVILAAENKSKAKN